MSGATFEHLKVLIVEDNAHMRALLRSLLAALEIKTIYDAANGTDGFELLCNKKPDLVLSDLTMQPVDGIHFTREVRTSSESPNPFVPVIMVTGRTERYSVEAARDAGVTEFIAKPITAQNLFSRIAEIVERPRAFVRCDGYFGPDRRRRAMKNYAGPWRRQGDSQNLTVR